MAQQTDVLSGKIEMVQGDPLTFSVNISIEDVDSFDGTELIKVQVKDGISSNAAVLEGSANIEASGLFEFSFSTIETSVLTAKTYYWNLEMELIDGNKISIFNEWKQLKVYANRFV